jgi:hypothetical protein
MAKPYRFLIHDRDSIFAKDVDQGLANLGVRVLRPPVRAPKANAVCEGVGWSLRRECLNFLIPFNEHHLQRIIREWTTHYNRGRPHSALGPGLPEPISEHVTPTEYRHRLPLGYRGEEIRTGRLASRIWSREGGCVATDLVFAHHTSLVGAAWVRGVVCLYSPKTRERRPTYRHLRRMRVDSIKIRLWNSSKTAVFPQPASLQIGGVRM